MTNPLLDRGYRYAGFGARAAATLVDTVVFMAASVPAMWLAASLFGVGDMPSGGILERVAADPAAALRPETYFDPVGLVDLGVNVLLPMIVVAWLWRRLGATPGKALLRLVVVDARTGGNLSFGRGLLRQLGYLVAAMPLCLGFLPVLWHPRRQGWHDRMAGSVVLAAPKRGVR